MNWYLISTKPHQERIAEQSLRRQAIETFCPRLKETKIIRRKWCTKVGPLFPGYLFARFALDTTYRNVAYAQGVRCVVSFGSSPAIVDEALIQTIQARGENGVVTLKPNKPEIGGKIIVREGPLHGIVAIFERELTGSQRAVLLLQNVAYQARVEVPLDYIAAS